MLQSQQPRNEESQNQPEGLLKDDLKANAIPVRKKNHVKPTTGKKFCLKQTNERPQSGNATDRGHHQTAHNGGFG